MIRCCVVFSYEILDHDTTNQISMETNTTSTKNTTSSTIGGRDIFMHTGTVDVVDLIDF